MASFRIHEDQENIHEPKRPQRITRSSKPPSDHLQKRCVLGIVNKNLPSTQSLKTSKEVILPQIPKQSAFFIHEDKETDENKPHHVGERKPLGLGMRNDKPQPKKITITNKQAILPSSITTLHRAPLQELPVLVLEDESEEKDEASESLAMSDTSVETIIFRAEVLHIQPTIDHLLHCEEYKDDIYSYLLEAELRNSPKPYYMKKQPDISYSMRSILVDWLVEVAEEYNLQTETLYLAVGYIDRFLSFMSVVRAKLQLVGTAAMFVASKYEEIYPPDVGEFVYITDDTYTKKQVLRMEHLILKVLSFDLSRPTTLSFIISFCASAKIGDTIQFLAMYVSELALLYADPFLQYAPSLVAASCIALARHTVHESPPWSNELQSLTGYSYCQLKYCMSELRRVHVSAPDYPQQAVRDKYRSSRRHNVSSISPRKQEEVID